MCTLYLDQQGSQLGREGLELVLRDREGGERCFPLEQIERVLVYGRIQLTADALSALLERGIPTTLLNSRGWLHGHLQGERGGQVRRRARQYALMQDEAAALNLARALVTAKLRNQRWLLRTHDSPRAPGLEPYIASARAARDVAALRGVEGSGAKCYFAAFAELLSGSPFAFPGRRKRPPTDPVNALLSLGYTLLLGELRSGLQGYGLDSFAGVFHASDGGQPSCALDLMEPLRPLVDRLVLRLAWHEFAPADFQDGADGACLVRDGRRGLFYAAWETLMQEPVLWQGEHRPYRQILHGQIGELAKHLDNPRHEFRPLALNVLGR
ncbi:MAG: CRISPR-associated endonuclease Cas1 [Candidatus Competibacteraceae bacterium]|nr:CRISPR-associated endonuclease Cas1 [Candidatus Competibacteraceae bacterium]